MKKKTKNRLATTEVLSVARAGLASANHLKNRCQEEHAFLVGRHTLPLALHACYLRARDKCDPKIHKGSRAALDTLRQSDLISPADHGELARMVCNAKSEFPQRRKRGKGF